MAKATQDVIVRVRVDGAGKAEVQIDRLGKEFLEVQQAANLLNKELQRNSEIADGSVAHYQRQISALKQIRNNTAKTAEEYAKQSISIEKLQVKMRSLTVSTNSFNKVNQDQISNAGLAGATLTEFGRTISDLPYGIRGIANNLSQLSTLFITLIAKSDGAGNAFKQLITQLRGPLGLILAFQAVIAALDFFSQKSEKAEEKTRDLTLSIKEQVVVNRELADALNEVNLTREEQEGIVSAIVKTEKDLKDILSDTTLSESQRNRVIQKYLVLREKEETLNEKLLESRKDLSEADLALAEAEKQRDNNLINLMNRLNSYEGVELTLADLRGKSVEQLKELHKERTKELYDYQEMANIGDLIADVSNAQDTYNENLKSHIELLKQSNILDLQRQKLLGKTKLSTKEVAEEFDELIGISGSFYGEFFRSSQKLNDNIAQLSKQRREIEIADIKLVLAEDIAALKKRADSKEEFEQGKRMLIAESLKKEIEAMKFALEFDRLTVKERISLRTSIAKAQAAITEIEGDRILDVAKEVMGALEFMAGALDANLEAEISREERKTVLKNNELKKRLRDESLSAKERESINNQIAANEESLQAKRDKLAEKQFKIQKAISIGQALVNTYEMATRAYNAVLAGPEKFLGVSSLVLAKIAAGVATSFGLAQVAAIARSKFVPSGISGGGGGAGGGAGIEAPDFNVVGASQTSQLAETVLGQQAKPVKAFVVGKDITTQQELDRNITNTASFG
jgi:hypothetical protein